MSDKERKALEYIQDIAKSHRDAAYIAFCVGYSQLERENAELKAELRENADSCSETSLDLEWCAACTSIRWCKNGQKLLAEAAERGGE